MIWMRWWARRLIRAGVPFNRTFFFIDKGTPRGLSYEYLTRFEEELNKTRKTGNLKVHVVMLPMPRDALIPALQAGKIDLVVAQLTVTPTRQELVDFTQPTRKNVAEVVVTGPGAPTIASLEDLSGREVYVRRSSSYFESLLALNKKLADGRQAPDRNPIRRPRAWKTTICWRWSAPGCSPPPSPTTTSRASGSRSCPRSPCTTPFRFTPAATWRSRSASPARSWPRS